MSPPVGRVLLVLLDQRVPASAVRAVQLDANLQSIGLHELDRRVPMTGKVIFPTTPGTAEKPRARVPSEPVQSGGDLS
jgi:hypothetical protein